MTRLHAALVGAGMALVLATSALAQQVTSQPAPQGNGGGELIKTSPLATLPSLSTTPTPDQPQMTTSKAPRVRVSSAKGAVLRGLDRVSGAVEDITIATGQTQRYGTLDITLGDCRYPSDNPESDAYAFLTITQADTGKKLFAGWMIASSPALDALDHPRYDVWVLHCLLPVAPKAGG